MPVCKGCGGSYDNQFKFCPHCGRAKPEPATININVTSDDVWEACEIILARDKDSEKKFLNVSVKFSYRFFAEAIGPKGRYQAAVSDILEQGNLFGWGQCDYYYYRGPDGMGSPIFMWKRDNAQQKLDILVKKLASDGWQPTSRGQEWYSERFKRKVKK